MSEYNHQHCIRQFRRNQILHDLSSSLNLSVALNVPMVAAQELKTKHAHQPKPTRDHRWPSDRQLFCAPLVKNWLVLPSLTTVALSEYALNNVGLPIQKGRLDSQKFTSSQFCINPPSPQRARATQAGPTRNPRLTGTPSSPSKRDSDSLAQGSYLLKPALTQDEHIPRTSYKKITVDRSNLQTESSVPPNPARYEVTRPHSPFNDPFPTPFIRNQSFSSTLSASEGESIKFITCDSIPAWAKQEYLASSSVLRSGAPPDLNDETNCFVDVPPAYPATPMAPGEERPPSSRPKLEQTRISERRRSSKTHCDSDIPISNNSFLRKAYQRRVVPLSDRCQFRNPWDSNLNLPQYLMDSASDEISDPVHVDCRNHKSGTSPHSFSAGTNPMGKLDWAKATATVAVIIPVGIVVAPFVVVPYVGAKWVVKKTKKMISEAKNRG